MDPPELLNVVVGLVTAASKPSMLYRESAHTSLVNSIGQKSAASLRAVPLHGLCDTHTNDDTANGIQSTKHQNPNPKILH